MGRNSTVGNMSIGEKMGQDENIISKGIRLEHSMGDKEKQKGKRWEIRI